MMKIQISNKIKYVSHSEIKIEKMLKIKSKYNIKEQNQKLIIQHTIN